MLVGTQYVTGEQWRNNSRKNEETESNQKEHPVVDVTDDGSKVRFYKEQYSIGTWDVRSMKQGKLEVVKQDMARVNADILGLSKLNELERVNLTPMTIMSTTVSKNPFDKIE